MEYMYFGSVRFFRHLILTVVFGWLGIATVLAVFFAVKCHTISKAAESESPASIEGYISEMEENGYSREDIIEYLVGESGIAPETEISDNGELPAMGTAVTEDTTAEITSETTTAPVITPPDESSDTAAVSTEDTTAKPQVTTSAETVTTAAQTTQKPQAAVPPKQTEAADDLYAQKAASKKAADKNTVFLSFEGINAENISDILIILDRQNVNAAFFVPQISGDAAAEAVARAADSGNTIGVFAGENKSFASAEAYLDEFAVCYRQIKKVCGAPAVYRIPDSAEMTAAVRSEVMAELDSRGFTHCTYNAESADRLSSSGWQEIMDASADNTYLNYTAGKATVLRMSCSYKTVTAAEDIITELKSDGFSFGLLDNSLEIE